mgnify:CR=1 FL=1
MKAKVTKHSGMVSKYYAVDITDNSGNTLSLRAPLHEYSSLADKLTGDIDTHDSEELLEYFERIAELINKGLWGK